MPKPTNEEQQIRNAWSGLCQIAEAWDWTAPRLLHEAEKSEARDARGARGAGVSYSKVEQLAGLCETALGMLHTPASLYRLRTGHRDVAIASAAMTDRFPEKMDDWRCEHGAAIRAFRAAALKAK